MWPDFVHPKCKMVTQWLSTIGDYVYESRPEMKVKTQDSQGKFRLTTRSQSTLHKTPMIKIRQIKDNRRWGASLMPGWREGKFDEGLDAWVPKREIKAASWICMIL